MGLIGGDTLIGFSIYEFLGALLGGCVLLVVLNFLKR